MDGEVADWLTLLVVPNAFVLATTVVIDLAIGDPVYAWHPVRLIGRALSSCERGLRSAGLDGYGGGMLLFVLLSATAVGLVAAIVTIAAAIAPALAWVATAFFVFSFLALGDLIHHVLRIERAVRSDDLVAARKGVSALVGRDTDRLDGSGCRRAGVESLSENLTDGFISPLFWYAIGGLAGLVVFKVVSTMDSMVGNKTPRYLHFGWCGARLDDVMNYVPARLSWVLIGAISAIVPGCSAVKAWKIGWRQHAIFSGPNSGWSEATAAGAIQRRLVGPIWLNGLLVVDVWIGDPSDPLLETNADVTRAITLATSAGIAAAVIACAAIYLITSS